MTNTNTKQKRAKAGGETGANGEFYEGGKFIATKDRTKGKPVRRSGPRKMNVEAYTWILVDDDNRLPLYTMLAGIELYDRATRTFRLNPAVRWMDRWGNGELPLSQEEVDHQAFRSAMCEAWNAGMRFRFKKEGEEWRMATGRDGYRPEEAAQVEAIKAAYAAKI